MSGGDPVQFLVIKPDTTITTRNEPLTVELLQNYVGGQFEALPVPGGTMWTLFANEDGHAIGLNPNWVATKMVRPMIAPDQFIVGTVVVTGLPDDEGEVTSLDLKAISAVMGYRDE